MISVLTGTKGSVTNMLSTPEQREELTKIQEAIARLPTPIVAAIAKTALFELHDVNFGWREVVTLAQLDQITDLDPEL